MFDEIISIVVVDYERLLSKIITFSQFPHESVTFVVLYIIEIRTYTLYQECQMIWSTPYSNALARVILSGAENPYGWIATFALYSGILYCTMCISSITF